MRDGSDIGRRAGLSARALVLGIFGVIACTYIVAHAELVLPATYMGAAHLPGASLAILLFLVPVNWLVRRTTKGKGLSAGEIILAYYMMTVASLIASFGLANHLLPGIIGLYYLADIAARWDLLSKNLRPWMVPFDLHGGPNQLVARRFYEGLRAGEHVPLLDWLPPLLFWSALFLLLTFAFFCIATILRKQWVEHERVSFPLVQLPVEIAKAQPVRGNFFGNWLTWAGFSIPFLFHAVNGLHQLYPIVPEIKVWILLNDYLPPGRPFDGLFYTPLVITFAPIGFAYFVPLDVLFSMWFFFLLSRFQGMMASLLAGSALLVHKVGHPAWVFIAYQSVGAFLVVVAYMVWASRSHLKVVLRSALGFVKGEDRGEPMPYRLAVFGLLCSFGLILVWAHFAGLSLPLAAGLFFILLFLIEPVLARCVAEGGLIMIQALFLPLDIPAMFVPRTAFGARNLVSLGIIDSVFTRDRRGSLLPTMFDSLKACDVAGVSRRAMFLALAVAIPVAMLSAFLIELWLCYHKGALNLRGAFTVALPFSMTRPYLQMLEAPPKPPGWQPPVFTLLGAAVTVFLYAMRARFPWWPFHPLGYAMGATWSLFPLWFAFMVGWLLKASILRYGGRPMFVKARPFFLGLIMGEYAAALVWVLVSCFTGKPGPSILQW